MSKNPANTKICILCEMDRPIEDFIVVTGNSTGKDWYVSIACHNCHADIVDDLLKELIKSSTDG